MGNLAESQPQILQKPVIKVVNQTVNPQFLSVFPSLLYYRNPCYVVNLLSNIQLT